MELGALGAPADSWVDPFSAQGVDIGILAAPVQLPPHLDLILLPWSPLSSSVPREA